MSDSQEFNCARCNEYLYPVERFGPIMKKYYHKSCFKCHNCNVLLELKTFCTNGDDLKDKNVYCQRHAPKPLKSNNNFGLNRSKSPAVSNKIPLVIENKVDDKMELPNVTIPIPTPTFTQSQNQTPAIDLLNLIISDDKNLEINTSSIGWTNDVIDNHSLPSIGWNKKEMPECYNNSNEIKVPIKNDIDSTIKTGIVIPTIVLSKVESEIDKEELKVDEISPMKNDDKLSSNSEAKFNSAIFISLLARAANETVDNKTTITDNAATFSSNTSTITTNTASFSSNTSTITSSTTLINKNIETFKKEESEIKINNIIPSVIEKQPEISEPEKPIDCNVVENVKPPFNDIIPLAVENEANKNIPIRPLEESFFSSSNIIKREIITEVFGQNKNLGRIRISVKYDEALSRLIVGIYEAKNLINTDKNSLSDPYARIYILPDEKKVTKKNTKIIKNNLNPVWNETFSYTMSFSEAITKSLYINLKDEKGFFEKQETQYLGEVSLKLNSIELRSGESKWYYLQPSSKK